MGRRTEVEDGKQRSSDETEFVGSERCFGTVDSVWTKGQSLGTENRV